MTKQERLTSAHIRFVEKTCGANVIASWGCAQDGVSITTKIYGNGSKYRTHMHHEVVTSKVGADGKIVHELIKNENIPECAHQFNVRGGVSRFKRCVKCGLIIKEN